MIHQLLSNVLTNQALVSLITVAIVGLLYRLVGAAGSALEALGEQRGILSLVVLGKRLEAIGFDAPKLKGLPGVNEGVRLQFLNHPLTDRDQLPAASRTGDAISIPAPSEPREDREDHDPRDYAVRSDTDDSGN